MMASERVQYSTATLNCDEAIFAGELRASETVTTIIQTLCAMQRQTYLALHAMVVRMSKFFVQAAGPIILKFCSKSLYCALGRRARQLDSETPLIATYMPNEDIINRFCNAPVTLVEREDIQAYFSFPCDKLPSYTHG